MSIQNYSTIPSERGKTDGSLSVERKKTDDAFAATNRTTERDADQEVEDVRASIDRNVAKDRAKSTLFLGRDDKHNDQLRDERRRADEHTADERNQADKTLKRERLERRQKEYAFFADQRTLTDTCLQFERTRADLASSFAAQLLTAEQAAHVLTKDAVTSRDEFLAIVSHDLRSPLSTISMCADALLEESELSILSGEQKQFVDIIRRQATSMNRLIIDLLDVEHMASGMLKLSPQVCDLGDLIEDVVESFQAWAFKQQIDLTADISASPAVAEVDRERIWQVLTNLIGNALKFTPRGGSVSVRIESTDAGLKLAVIDTGPGVPEDQQTLIFERFSQLKNRDRRGVGLGLFIAKWIVEAHQGMIGIESKMGEGSTFSFKLPRVQVPCSPV